MPKAPRITPNVTSPSTHTESPVVNGKAPGKPRKSKSIPPAGEGRPLVYPDYASKICLAERGNALTDAQAKKIMGWEEEPEGSSFPPDEVLLTDFQGKKIRCTNNPSNRPFYYNTVVIPLKQEILNRKWRCNCENRIIGRTALVLNGQHTFAALILACQEWEANPEKFPAWQERPTIDTFIAFGCPEDDETVNTMDTCKSRSLIDVLYRHELFRSLPKGKRVLSAKRLSDAIKLLWHRTGASMDAFRPKRTHSESIFFSERHPRLLTCVHHIQEENGSDNRITRYLPIGYAAAMMFLMGSSSSEREKEDGKGYIQVADPTDSLLDWSRWESAEKFWTQLAAGATEMDPIRESLGRIFEDEGGLSMDERLGLIAKAWVSYIENGDITVEDLEMDYEIDGEGRKKLIETPTCGGIDIGRPT